MFSLEKHLFLCVIIYIFHSKSCVTEPSAPPTLALYSPSDLEYTDVLVRREHDTLTLVCELTGDASPRTYVWNYLGNGTRDRTLKPDAPGPSPSSRLVLPDLQEADSGHYMCSAPPFSVTKYIVVQPKGPMECAKGAFWCGVRCVLASYVCDGRRDCLRGEDELDAVCGADVCSQPHKLKCSGGRCISASACCLPGASLCKQPSCCPAPRRADGYMDAEYPPLYEDRRAPDDYGFIQSTIYTVTACALIFMIAVVLLVSAICKMQMKRAALRGYSHNGLHIQSARFPPCYEASRLLEERGSDASTFPPDDTSLAPCDSPARGLPRLSDMFSARYTQVATSPPDVELRPLPPRPPLPGGREGGPDAACIEGAVGNQCRRDRLTLQLGRFQLSLPRLARPRPATPTVPQLDITQVDFVRLADTYTLNGRTIRLLGAEFDCPMGSGSVPPPGARRPPSYLQAVRCKLYGPPPQYLSREGINRRSADHVDEDAANNVEMPPSYYELSNNSVNAESNVNNVADNVESNVNNVADNVESNVNNVADNVENTARNNVTENNAIVLDNNINSNDTAENNVNIQNNVENENNRENITILNNVTEIRERENNVNSVLNSNSDTVNGNDVSENSNSNIETLSSIIDNLPAIDSDVNANDCDDVTNSINSSTALNRSAILSNVANDVILNNN